MHVCAVVQMLTVATSFEAPVKFIYPLAADMQRAYPYAVLGLGDIVIPAIVIAMLRNLDIELLQADETAAATATDSSASIYNWAGGRRYRLLQQ
jgi:Signal peptide peptidase